MNEFIAEIVGTFILIYLGCGVVAGVLLKDSKAENSGWLVITIAWGLSVTMAIYAVGNISGAHINPAVTLGLAAAGKFAWSRVAPYILAQFIGAILGSVAVYFHYLPHWKHTKDTKLKLAVFSTAPAIRNNFSNLFSEISGTFALLFLIMAIGANEFTQGLNPLIIGALILTIGLCLGGTTGFAINPARDLGPRLAHFLLPIHGKGDSDWSYAWIPVLGPILGGITGSLSYVALYENTCSPLLYVALFLLLLILTLGYIFRNKH